MKNEFYIPKQKYSHIYGNIPVKITKAEGNSYYYCCGAERKYFIEKNEFSRFKVCPKYIIAEEVAWLKELLQFYTE